MIAGLTWLLGCQLVGEVLVRATGAPVPGPVAGMVVLFVVLRVGRTGDDAAVERTADGLLRHLQLLFVPAGAAAVGYLGVLRADALPIGVALVGSWLLGLAVVGWTVALLGRGAEA